MSAKNLSCIWPKAGFQQVNGKNGYMIAEKQTENIRQAGPKEKIQQAELQKRTVLAEITKNEGGKKQK